MARWHKIPKFTEIKPEKNLSCWSFPIGLSRGASARQTLVPCVRNHPYPEPHMSVGSCNGTEIAAEQGATDPICAPTRAFGQATQQLHCPALLSSYWCVLALQRPELELHPVYSPRSLCDPALPHQAVSCREISFTVGHEQEVFEHLRLTPWATRTPGI